jgi:predicted transporter
MKVNYKVQFCLFVVSLFFIGLGIYETANEGLKTGKELFWQISHFVPFVTGALIFGNNLYSKRIQSSKN